MAAAAAAAAAASSEPGSPGGPSSPSSPSPSPSSSSCVLCCGELEVVALGRCEHPICYRCSVRMRALCGVRYCAVCREELAQVVFGRKLTSFSTIALSQLQHEKKYDIYFTDGKVYALYRKLLQHECPLCPEARPFATVVDLEQHMRKQHELFCCKLCVKHLKIFTYERKWYTRKDLARHRIHGDPDDTSHRGHPLCKFCDERYLDNDELLKHLRRDHYFCHFCDSDGAQEYYSDYEYLREHFREKHFLCEEGRCSTEQFTHAFRTEIDYKAHKTACHSKNRAEARQNRQIDLQFNYAPRHQRRNEGVVSGEDYEEVNRYHRQTRGGGGRAGLRGGQQNRRGSWRYKREEEDRDIAAAVRASMAAKRQEEKKHREEKEEGARAKREEAKDPDSNASKRGPKPPAEAPAPKEAASKPVLSAEDFPAIGSAAAAAALAQGASPAALVRLDEEDFPSLSSSSFSSSAAAPASSAPAVSSAMALTYAAPARKGPFQEEDFPALVSRVQPKTTSTLTSAWSCGSGKNMVKAMAATTTGSGSSSSTSQPARKTAPAGSQKGGKKTRAAPPNDTNNSVTGAGLSIQGVRSAPAVVGVSSLLTAPNPQAFIKVGKKKKVGAEKSRGASSPLPREAAAPVPPAEKAPEADPPPKGLAHAGVPEGAAGIVNGHPEKATLPCTVSKEPPGLKKAPSASPALLPPEDFPALGNSGLPRKPPPPGFNSVVLLNSAPPPPGLSVPVGKPPPGFVPIPPTAVPETAPPAPAAAASVKESKPCQGPYLILENFQQRNIQLIHSIKEFLQEDESQFNKFKTYSGQFRQGLISADQYYQSCQDLLGENFGKIFSELLVLLPDTAKQRELLATHHDLKAKSGDAFSLSSSSSSSSSSSAAALSRSRKTKGNAWQTGLGSDLDCCVCPTCQQVLTQQDLAAHKALHREEEEEFPSLQAISRIIS